MRAPDIAVAVLLAICVVSSLICCYGLLAFRDLYERLHFMSVVTTISSFGLLFAVVVKQGWGQGTIKSILVVIVLLLINAVLSHATARAARVREFGHWTPQANENIKGAGAAQPKR